MLTSLKHKERHVFFVIYLPWWPKERSGYLHEIIEIQQVNATTIDILPEGFAAVDENTSIASLFPRSLESRGIFPNFFTHMIINQGITRFRVQRYVRCHFHRARTTLKQHEPLTKREQNETEY